MNNINCRVTLLLFSLLVCFGCTSESEVSPKIVIHDVTGKTIVNNSGVYDFGLCSVDHISFKTFRISNIGDIDLELTGNPLVNITGDDADQFSVYQQPKQMIASGLSTIFTIQFEPTKIKQCNAAISIVSNDIDVPKYVFAITGTSNNAYFDFNGDGYNDILVGAPNDDDGGSNSGCAFIFLGSANPTSSIKASDADVKFVYSNADDLLGTSVSNAGDVNMDGYDDVIIGALDLAFIIFGSSNPAPTVNVWNANVRLYRNHNADHFGCSVSGVGDVNNDGHDDVIVGAYQDDDNGDSSGCAFVFFGRSLFDPSIGAFEADIKLIGSDAGDEFGFSVSGAGDVNGDGFDDIIVGAPGCDSTREDYGSAFIFLGSDNPPYTIDAVDANLTIRGTRKEDYLGYSVSGAGDVNGDGFDDVIIGSNMLRTFNAHDIPGYSYIFLGKANFASADIEAWDADVSLSGKSYIYFDNYGMSVSGAGDLNGDGFDDVLVGANNNSVGTVFAGSVYVYFGNSSPQTNMQRYAVLINGEEENSVFGYSVGCIGDMNNDGFCDVIVSTPYDDDGGENSGAAFVFYGRQTWASPYTASDADVKIIGDDIGDNFGFSVSRK